MISVLSVSYRCAGETAGLVESLIAHPPDEPLEVVIVNHSPEQKIDLPCGARPIARIIDRANAGYAAGINAAYAESRGDLLLVANPDLRVTPGALSAARRYLSEHTEVGVLLPRLRYPDGRVQLSARRFYTWPVAIYARSPLRALGIRPAFFRRYHYEDVDLSAPRDVDWGFGGALFIRRSDVQHGHIFDPRYFLYFEDVDLCLETWRRGRRVVYCPEVECIHAHQRRSAVPFGRHGWHHLRSFLRFVLKHRGLPQRPTGR